MPEGVIESALPWSAKAGDLLRQQNAEYRRYRWPVNGVDDLRLAPFHVLAYEGHATLQNGHR